MSQSKFSPEPVRRTTLPDASSSTSELLIVEPSIPTSTFFGTFPFSGLPSSILGTEIPDAVKVIETSSSFPRLMLVSDERYDPLPSERDS